MNSRPNLTLMTTTSNLATSAQNIARILERWNFEPPKPYEPVTTAIPKLEAFITWADKQLQSKVH
jgi:hypothetical protein